MRVCPKCGWRQTTYLDREVYAKRPDRSPVLIRIGYEACLRKGCDWYHKEDYEAKVARLGLEPWDRLVDGLPSVGI